jgi:hypothetical protein
VLTAPCEAVLAALTADARTGWPFGPSLRDEPGGAVVRQTGVGAEVAAVVERQADPYREQTVSARVVRAVNAYEEKTRNAGPKAPPKALGELRLGTARDCQPQVVEALARVPARNGAAR